MSENFTPLLQTNDWNEEWKNLQAVRRRADNVGYWDERAKTFQNTDAPNSYSRIFLERAGVKPGETVFDMGCGTGALTIPLAKQGNPVIAADFSPKMLEVLQGKLEELHLDCVTTKLMSWDDNWNDFGIGEASVDVAFASRSIATGDLKKSLLKLNAVVKRRVCITIISGLSPRIHEQAMHDIGLVKAPGQDFQYAFNILVNEGIRPEISYINSKRRTSFDSAEEAFASYAPMVDYVAPDYNETEKAAALLRLTSWIEEHLVRNEQAGKITKDGSLQKALCLDVPRNVSWAFLTWDK